MPDLGFQNIPQNLREPLFYVELDNSKANTGQDTKRSLVIGQVLAGSSAVPGKPILSQGVTEAKTIAGQGSMLARMVEIYRRADPFGELWILPVADNAAGVAATGTITFTSAATSAGTLNLYIGGQRLQLAVSPAQTTAQLATALASAITATLDLPITAAAAASAVTVTAKNKGAAAGDIQLALNFGGSQAGEVTPAGLGVTLAAMTGGSGEPVLTAALANLLDKTFDFIAFPYTDATSLDAAKALMSTTTGRWSWASQIYGHVFAGYRGTLSVLNTFGATRNDEHMSIMGVDGSPDPAYVWATSFAAAVANSVRADPARPLQTVQLVGVTAPALEKRFGVTDRNILDYVGISTVTVGDDGTVRISVASTTYQKNAYGVADNSYFAVETMYTIAEILRRLRAMITSQFARCKLANDGARVPAGGYVVTPSIIKAALIAQYASMIGDLTDDLDTFKAGLVVQRNSLNPSRVDVLFDPVLIGQLRVFAMLFQFRLIA